MGASIFTDLLFMSLMFDYAGKALLAILMITVYAHILKEHRIDHDVLAFMKRGRVLGLLGLLFITIGYLLRLHILGYL